MRGEKEVPCKGKAHTDAHRDIRRVAQQGHHPPNVPRVEHAAVLGVEPHIPR